LVLPINPSKVAFEMSLYYMTSDRYKGDIIPEGFSSADEMVLLFEKDKYSINCRFLNWNSTKLNLGHGLFGYG
jgi:hypothetical protein